MPAPEAVPNAAKLHSSRRFVLVVAVLAAAQLLLAALLMLWNVGSGTQAESFSAGEQDVPTDQMAKEKPCRADMSPFRIYSRTGRKYHHADSAQLEMVLDQNKAPWVVKSKELRAFVGEDWDVWQEIAPMRQDMPFNLPLREVYLTSTRIYIVMPELTHGDLWSICYPDEGEDMSVYEVDCKPRVHRLAAQMAFGLWELHQRGMMHRDIKGPNVLLLDEHGENITLIDYDGAAVGCREKRGQACSFDYEQGSPAYLSKSIAEGRGYGYEADWWSWAVVVCMIRFNVDPFGDDVAGYPSPFWMGDPLLEERDPALVRLLHLTIGVDSATLEQPPIRLAMESPLPERHPVLSHDYWLPGRTFSTKVARDKALREFWRDVCFSHAREPERLCADLFRPKPSAVATRRCENADGVRCSCRQGACERDARGEIKEWGVDDNRAVESAQPGGGTVCCSRHASWHKSFPDGNGSFANAPCYELFMEPATKEAAAGKSGEEKDEDEDGEDVEGDGDASGAIGGERLDAGEALGEEGVDAGEARIEVVDDDVET